MIKLMNEKDTYSVKEAGDEFEIAWSNIEIDVNRILKKKE